MRLSPKFAVVLIVGCLCVASPSLAGSRPFQYDLIPREVPVMGDPDSGTGGAGQQAPPGKAENIVQTSSHVRDVSRAAILEIMMSLMRLRTIAR